MWGLWAYALVGMGTAFAGVVRAPMTSDDDFEYPRLCGDCAADDFEPVSFVASRFQKEPIYEVLAIRMEFICRRRSRTLKGTGECCRRCARLRNIDADTTLRDAIAKTQASF
jgi:hypothetical protein